MSSSSPTSAADTLAAAERAVIEGEKAQRRLAAIIESSEDAIASKDLNGIITSWNKSAERLFGYTAEEIIGQPVTLIIPPELHDDEPRILGKIRAGERIEHFQTVRVHKNGQLIDVSLTVSPIRDDQGNIVGAAKIVRDITRQKKLEEAALRLAAIVESSDDAIASKDLNGTLPAGTAALKNCSVTRLKKLSESRLRRSSLRNCITTKP